MTTTNRLLLSLLLLTLAAPATRADDAEPFEWAGAWQTDGGATRTVEGAGRPGHQRSLEWTPTRGAPVRLAGAGNDATLALSGRRPGAVGISEKLQGEQVDARADTRLQLVATRAADDAEGRQVAEVTIRAGRETTRERWTRRGPTRLEVVSCSVADDWNPKTGPLTLEYRLLGAPARLRLRVLVASASRRGQSDAERRVADRRQAAYRALAAHEGDALVHEAPLGEVKAGTHTATWDGRDDTAAKRLVHGGRLLLVVEAVDLPDVKRAERALQVAAPVTQLVAPNWPRRNSRDPGRDRAQVHARVQDGTRRLGFDELGAQRRTATPQELSNALQTSAVVFVATHGSEKSLSLYMVEGDELERSEHSRTLDDWEIERLPMQDLHTVIIWACLAGRERIPAALLAGGCDNVVGFSWSIDSNGTEAFLESLLTALLTGNPRTPAAERRPLSVSEASRVAAAHATHIIWDNVTSGEKGRRQVERDNRAENARNAEHGEIRWAPHVETAPYTDCLVTYSTTASAGVDEKTNPDTHLEVARWGNSTNTTTFDRVAQKETEFTRMPPKSSK